ncbi:hypothetical protein BDV29DRAFT_147952 [Aspergillus leporis]|uniref:Uncharacterized protein n=1 Tax=Aspergillus leporis TaxID=41062 RepID=A0A5N5WWP9_9EURO|nr:hypothetical protein BDV29DRAFT_147952 [Aspergillus leporis]
MTRKKTPAQEKDNKKIKKEKEKETGKKRERVCVTGPCALVVQCFCFILSTVFLFPIIYLFSYQDRHHLTSHLTETLSSCRLAYTTTRVSSDATSTSSRSFEPIGGDPSWVASVIKMIPALFDSVSSIGACETFARPEDIILVVLLPHAREHSSCLVRTNSEFPASQRGIQTRPLIL